MSDTIDQRTFEHATFEVGGHEIEVVAVEGVEAVGKMFRFEVTCLAEVAGHGARPASAHIGGAATLLLRDGFGAERAIHGVVAEATRRAADAGVAELRFVLRPAEFALTLGRDCRVFQDLDVVGIGRKVLPTARFDVLGSYAKRVYTAQYREDDWTFISRLFEEEGLFVWFDHHGGGTTMVVGDESTSAPDLHGGALVPFAYGTGASEPRELVQELATEAALAPSKFTVKSFDPARVDTPVGGAHGAGAMEIYMARGGGSESPDVCSARARVVGQAAAAAAATVAGRTSSIRVAPGMHLVVDDHPRARLNGRYFVTEVTYAITQRRRFGGGDAPSTYTCRFRAGAASTPFRLAATTPPAKQAGLQTGFVVGPAGSEIHPDATGRVRVQLAWDREGQRDENAGKFMRIAQRGASESMLLPRVGWTVLTSNQEGSVDAPTIICRIHDGDHLPSYPLPEHKTRLVFKTATSPGGGSFNEIRFEDKDGGEQMFINASRDMNVFVLNKKTEIVENDNTRTIGNDHVLNVRDDYTEDVAGDKTLAIGADETITAKASTTTQVRQDEDLVVGGSRHLTTGDAHTTTVRGTRTLAVGAAMIELSLGDISTTAQTSNNLLVGGAVVRVTEKSISESSNIASVQTIGGLKLETCSKNRVIGVGKKLFETVGGAIVMSADKKYMDAADKTMSWKVGVKLAAKAPDVTIEAKEKITLSCGSSSITIDATSVTIAADAFDLSEASDLVAQTALIDHNH